jgi:hypothetical protein
VTRPEDGLVDYRQFARLVNWRCHTVPPLKVEPVDCDDHKSEGTLIQNVDVLAIMQDIDVLRPKPRDPCESVDAVPSP